MNKIILKDKTAYEIADSTGINAITITVDSYEDLKTIEEAFTKEDNLEEVTFEIDEETNGEYKNLKLVSKTFDNVHTDEETGKVTVIISLADMTDVDIAIRELQRGQALQDSAIADLGDVVSEIVPEEE